MRGRIISFAEPLWQDRAQRSEYSLCFTPNGDRKAHQRGSFRVCKYLRGKRRLIVVLDEGVRGPYQEVDVLLKTIEGAWVINGPIAKYFCR